MNIEHKTTPIEHWIVDGKAYRLAGEKDVGKECYRSDYSFENAIDGDKARLKGFIAGYDMAYHFSALWRYAYIQDDSLLQPNADAGFVEFEVKRTPVPELGDGWYQLTAEDGGFKKGDKANASLTDGSGWVNCDCIEGKSLKEWIEGNCRAARYFGKPQVEHIIDCVTVEQAIAQRIMDDKVMKQAKSTTKPIDWTKPVRTKDGRAVRVLCTDGPDKKHPIIGCISGSEDVYTWAIAGTYYECDEHVPSELDLENAPQRIQREYWVNVYKDSGYDAIHISAEYAAEFRSTEQKCQACVKITIDCEEGEGL